MIVRLVMLISIGSTLCLASVSPDRMSQAQARDLLGQVSEVVRAVDERNYAISSQSEIMFTPRHGSPSSVVHQVKSEVRSLAPLFIDLSKEIEGTYDFWFSAIETNRYGNVTYVQSYPLWSATNLQSFLLLSSDALFSTPQNGKQLLESENLGVGICSDALGALRRIPIIDYVQMNDEQVYANSTNQIYSVTDYDVGVCGTNDCTTREETITNGHELSYSSCSIPAANSIVTNSIGPAKWEISFDSSYSSRIAFNADDYTCLAGNSRRWDRTRTEDHAVNISYSLRSVLGVTLVFTNLKRDIKGEVFPYAKYSYTSQEDQVVTRDEIIGCTDLFCDLYDDEGNPDGSYKCGAEEDFESHEYMIPGWDPELIESFSSAGSYNKGYGTNSVYGPVSVTANPFAGVTPSVIHSENYACDAISEPHGFSLWCYGILGYSLSVSSCDATIPYRFVKYEIGPVYLEAQFDYCP